MTECCHFPCPHEATLCYGLWMVVFLTRKFNPCIVKHLLICFLTSFFSESSPRPPRHPLHVKHMTILLYYLLFCFHHVSLSHLNTFAASYLNTQGLNNSCLKSPASTLVDLTFQSCALRSFSLNQLHNLSLQAGNLHSSFSISSWHYLYPFYSSVCLHCDIMNPCLRQPTLPLSIRINTGSLYRNVSILNSKRDKYNVS